MCPGLFVFGEMKTITAIEAQRRIGDRANVFLDSVFAFSMRREVIVEQGLHPGQVLSDSRVEELMAADLSHHCLETALRLISYRPRSEMELRARLSRSFDGETIDGVVLKLKLRQMIDDVAFAEFWRDGRESFSPRSKRLIKWELKRKGIHSEVADEVLEAIDDEESAYRAAERRASILERDYEVFKRKLGAFLTRRGFSYEVTYRTVERLWRELGQESSP